MTSTRALLVTALVATTAGILTHTAEAQRPGRGYRCDRPAMGPDRPHTVLGPSGLTTVTARVEQTGCVARASGYVTVFNRYGMVDAAGRVQIPVTFRNIAPFAPDAALVQDEEDGSWSMMTFGEPARGRRPAVAGRVIPALPLPRCTAPTGPSVAAVVPPPDAAGVSTFSIYAGSRTPSPPQRVGGPGVARPFVRIGTSIVLTWEEDGRLLSRVVDAAGQALSPILGEVQPWLTWKHYSHPQYCSSMNELPSVDAMMVGPSLDAEGTSVFGPLLLPVAPDGQLQALPDGVVGLFALGMVDNRPEETHVWGVVFPTNDGFEFALHYGAPAAALAAAPSLPRYRHLSWPSDRTIAIGKSDGMWQVVSRAELAPLGEARPGLQGALAAANEASAARNAQIQAESARQRAAHLATLRAEWDRLLASPNPCNYRPSWDLGMQTFLEFAAKCSHTFTYTDVNMARHMGVPADQVARWEGAVNADVSARRRADAEAAASWPNTVTFEQAARAFGDRVVRSIQVQTENWLTERRRRYYEELERANRR